MTKQQLLQEVRNLSREEQLDLANEIWDLEPVGATISPDLAAELDRRLAEDDANPSAAQDWDEFRLKLARGDL